VAFSTAIKADNVELVEARRLGVACISPGCHPGAICRTRRTWRERHARQTRRRRCWRKSWCGRASSPGHRRGEGPRAQGGAAMGPGQWLVVEATSPTGTFLRLGAAGRRGHHVEAITSITTGPEEGPGRAFRILPGAGAGAQVVCLDRPRAAPGRRSAGVTTYGRPPQAAYHIEGTRTVPPELPAYDAPRRAVPSVLSSPRSRACTTSATPCALATAAAIGVGPTCPGALAAYTGVGRRFELRGSRTV